MSGVPQTKPWFEDAAALVKQRYSGSSATANETERRILQAAQRRRRAPKAWWIIPGIIVAVSLSMSFYIALDRPNLDAPDVLRASWELVASASSVERVGERRVMALERAWMGWG